MAASFYTRLQLSVLQNSVKRPFWNCLTYMVIKRDYKKWKNKYHRELFHRRLKAGPEQPRHPSKFGIWNWESELYAFGKRFGEEFKDGLLKTALTTSSYVEMEEERRRNLGIDDDSVPLDLEDNTQLARKGEAVCSRYIKAFLRYTYPMMFEEGICAVHDYLMSDEVLNFVGKKVGLRDLIFSAEYPPEDNRFGLTLKAIIGAIAESTNEERAGVFVKDFILTHLVGKDINEIWELKNPMGLLCQILEAQGRGPPEPRLLWKSATETMMSVYHVGIYSDKKLIGKSPGETVAIAEEMAAREALKSLMGTTDSRAPLPLGPEYNALTLNYEKQNLSISQLQRQRLADAGTVS